MEKPDRADENHILDKIWIRNKKIWTVGIIRPSNVVIIAPRENLLRQLFIDVWMQSKDTFDEHVAKATAIFGELRKEARKLDYIR